MLKTEFEERVKMSVSDDEYYHIIEPMYMASDVEKDEFCSLWRKMNRNRVALYREEKRRREEHERLMYRLWKLEQKLFSLSISAAVYMMAEDLISDRDINLLKSVGIKTREWVEFPGASIEGFYRHRNVDSVWHELREYLDNQAA